MKKLKQALALLDVGQVDKALTILKKKQKNASDDEKFLIADIYYERGFFEEAIELMEELLKKYPKEGQLLTQLAEMYIELEEDEVAIQLLSEVEEDDSFYVASLIQLADLYQAQGLFEVSEQKLLQAKKLAPEEKVIDFALGELFFSMGDFSRAITNYERIASKTKEINQVSIIERLAECHALLGRYEKALDYYIELDSKNPNTMFKYGFTAYQAKRNEIAIAQWEKLIEADPHYHSAYYQLAQVYKEENMFDKAFETVQQGLKYDDFNKELFLLAGELAIHIQKEEEAIDYLKRAIRLDSDYREAILLLIQIYTETHDYEKVIALITDVKRQGATDPLYDWELAKAYREEEKYEEALYAYKDASFDLQHDSEFLQDYGYFLTEEGLVHEAIETLDRYLQLVPDDEEVRAFVERLKLSNEA